MTKKVLFPVGMNPSNYLISKFSKYIDLEKSEILEIGIGNGRFGSILSKKFSHYYGIDIDREYVKIAKTNIPKGSNVTYKLGNAQEIPFDKKFDIIFLLTLGTSWMISKKGLVK